MISIISRKNGLKGRGNQEQKLRGEKEEIGKCKQNDTYLMRFFQIGNELKALKNNEGAILFSDAIVEHV